MSSRLPVLRLARGREGSLRRRHPWIFSGAVGSMHGLVPGEANLGETVRVEAADGTFLAFGAFSPQSQIRARVWSFDAEANIDGAWIRGRIAEAADRRRARFLVPESAVRLVHGESDGLPGLVVDRFRSVAVVQILSAGAECWRPEIVEALMELPGIATVYERSDVEARSKEGLEPRTGLLAGDPLPESLEIVEDGRRYRVEAESGHKTGFYLDQRPNRSRLHDLVCELASTGALSTESEMLDVFCYSGGFSVAGASAGLRRIAQIDASEVALQLAKDHLQLAGWDGELEQIHGNAFGELRKLRADGRRFDVIIMDPPKFADSKARVERASRGYKDVNWLAFQLLRPGGHLLTFSCSGRVTAELFGKIVASSAADAGRDVQVLARLGAGSDHPTALAFPEGAYLKGLLCRAL